MFDLTNLIIVTALAVSVGLNVNIYNKMSSSDAQDLNNTISNAIQTSMETIKKIN